MTEDRPPLASGTLDRDAGTRETPERLRAAWHEPRTRVLRIRGVEVPVWDGGDSAPQLALQAAQGELPVPSAAAPVGALFLGRVAGDAVFGIAVPAADEASGNTDAGTPAGADASAAANTGDAAGAPRPERWAPILSVAEALDHTERELVTVAAALLRWHEAAAYSPRDGEPTEVVLGGWGRRDARGGELFPRTDPAVIVLIEHEERILLGSNALWESGRFSLLAGFVEAGEALETTVAREVFEEAGVRLDHISYVTSQPWPFPRSLMLGFRARLAVGADPDDLTPDPAEISELRWFSRAQLRDPEPGIVLPGAVSIARWMIDQWVAEGDADDR